jgi:hypothetical protein
VDSKRFLLLVASWAVVGVGAYFLGQRSLRYETKIGGNMLFLTDLKTGEVTMCGAPGRCITPQRERGVIPRTPSRSATTTVPNDGAALEDPSQLRSEQYRAATRDFPRVTTRKNEGGRSTGTRTTSASSPETSALPNALQIPQSPAPSSIAPTPRSTSSIPRVEEKFFTVGSTQDEVSRVQGAPTRTIQRSPTEEWWYYSSSIVVFRDGRVHRFENKGHLRALLRAWR